MRKEANSAIEVIPGHDSDHIAEIQNVGTGISESFHISQKIFLAWVSLLA
jgi:hypothetical protein